MVHIFWRGKGWVVAVITFTSSLASEVITESIARDETLYQKNLLPLSISLIVSGLLTFYLVNRLSVTNDDGYKSPPGKAHSLFFIPIVYWGWMLIAIGSFTMIIQSIH